MTASVAEIIASVRISEIYRESAGVEPHKGGPGRWRGRATWRGGDGLTVSMDDSRGSWHDFKTGDRGGVLDLVIRIRGGSRADALRWVADFVGIPLENRALTPRERAAYARERSAFQRDLRQTRYWRRAAILLCEETLAVLKAAFFDPTAERVDAAELTNVTRLEARLQRANDSTLVNEFRLWRQRNPVLTAGMVAAAERLEAAERRALQRYIAQMEGADGTEH